MKINFFYFLECYNRSMDVMEIRDILLTRCEVDPERPLLVAVSGGPDSLCLVDILFHTQIPVIIAHFDHRLRSSSNADLLKVQSYARKKRIKFVSESVDVRKFSQEKRLSIEEGAREARYSFLFRQAEKLKAQAVVTGHTADDQIETILMHLLRGSGMAGLRGMAFRSDGKAWGSSIPLIRPLLTTWRSETISYCDQNNLEIVLDESNKDTRFYRNRIRLELIPLLESYNPKFKPHLLETAELIQLDYESLAHHIDQLWQHVIIRETDQFIILDGEILKKSDLSEKRMIFRKAIALLHPGLRDIRYEVIQRAVRFITNPPQSFYDELVGNLCLSLVENKVILHKKGCSFLESEWDKGFNGEIAYLHLEEQIKRNGWNISCSTVNENNFDWITAAKADSLTAYLDYDFLEFPLMIRSQKEGDRFKPFGMKGHSLKLSDFWINSNIPRWERPQRPLVCSGEEIVWIPGLRIADSVKITTNTKKIVRISFRKI